MISTTPRSPLERRLRTASRVSLYGSLALALGLGSAFLPFADSRIEAALDQSWYDVDYQADPRVKLLQQLVRIDTSEPTGNEQEAARLLAARLEEAGIPAHLELLPDRKANLWAILEGREKRALVLHNHLDVEPIGDPKKWFVEPFGGTIEPPWIYGRGAFDMKSVTVAQLDALLELKRRLDAAGQQSEISVIFLATSSEETGSDLGTRWILAQHPELAARFWGVLTEGGVLEATERGKVKYWGISFAQKRFLQVTACHPSRERLEALAEDARALNRGFAVRVTPEVRRFLQAYAHTRNDPHLRRILTSPDSLHYQARRWDYLPGYLKALFRSEIAVFPIEEDAEGGGFRLRMSLHLLPGADAEVTLRQLLPTWITHGVALSVLDLPSADGGSPVDHPLFQTVSEVVSDRYGDIPQGPYFLSFYANDSRFFIHAGVPAYGFNPFQALTTDSVTISGPNERIALPEFLEGVELYRELVARLAGLVPGQGSSFDEGAGE